LKIFLYKSVFLNGSKASGALSYLINYKFVINVEFIKLTGKVQIGRSLRRAFPVGELNC
jgi:hypothetical protein